MAKYTDKQTHSQQVLSPSPVNGVLRVLCLVRSWAHTHNTLKADTANVTGFVGQNLRTGNFVDPQGYIQKPACVRDDVWTLPLFQIIIHQTFKVEQISPLIFPKVPM